MPKQRKLPHEVFIQELKGDILLLKQTPSNGGFISALTSNWMPKLRNHHLTQFIALDWEKKQQENDSLTLIALNELERLFVLIWNHAKERKDKDLLKGLCMLVRDISLGENFQKGNPICRLYLGLEELYVKKRYLIFGMHGGMLQFHKHPFAPVTYKVFNPHLSKEPLTSTEIAPWLMWSQFCLLEVSWQSRDRAFNMKYQGRIARSKDILLKQLHECYCFYIDKAKASELQYIDYDIPLKFFGRRYIEHLLDRLLHELAVLLCHEQIRLEKEIQEKAIARRIKNPRTVHFQQDLTVIKSLIMQELSGFKYSRNITYDFVIQKVKVKIKREKIKLHGSSDRLFIMACRSVAKETSWRPIRGAAKEKKG